MALTKLWEIEFICCHTPNYSREHAESTVHFKQMSTEACACITKEWEPLIPNHNAETPLSSLPQRLQERIEQPQHFSSYDMNWYSNGYEKTKHRVGQPLIGVKVPRYWDFAMEDPIHRPGVLEGTDGEIKTKAKETMLSINIALGSNCRRWNERKQFSTDHTSYSMHNTPPPAKKKGKRKKKGFPNIGWKVTYT